MNLNGKTMVAVTMMVASLAAAGCSTANAEEPVAPEESAATAPVEQASTNGVEKDSRFIHFYAPFAPPAARIEFRGVAPSARHFWAPGYYRWTGRDHVWVGGSWVLERPGFVFQAPHWRSGFRRFEYVPGRWVRRF